MAGQMRSLRCQWRAPLRTCVILSAEAISYTEIPQSSELAALLVGNVFWARCGVSGLTSIEIAWLLLEACWLHYISPFISRQIYSYTCQLDFKLRPVVSGASEACAKME